MRKNRLYADVYVAQRTEMQRMCWLGYVVRMDPFHQISRNQCKLAIYSHTHFYNDAAIKILIAPL